MTTKQPVTLDFRHYGTITVPAGVRLTHQTALGIDTRYHLVNEFGWIDTDYPDFANILKMDAQSCGINIPVEFVEI